MPPRAVPAHLQQPNQDNDYAFFVHPSEGPNSLTVSLKLNGSNYIAWYRSMQQALGTKDKLGFINGSILFLILLLKQLCFTTLHLRFGRISRTILKG